ncbi:uncharacterized protein LOC115899235 isoform X2 [Rhinopithecus roxellana]|uniref:uncharacterized protein LOC115899235 isoform X2 n=1 Tax=Rhinopithecus roxellana TaxID=61622 RepID=UPI0012370F6F|nr:uncharacterized protein LOC115899235 isoform X2 [Rhinopithecus roxellana]
MPWASHWVPVLCFIPRYQKGGIWMSGATFNPEKARVPKQQEDVQAPYSPPCSAGLVEPRAGALLWHRPSQAARLPGETWPQPPNGRGLGGDVMAKACPSQVASSKFSTLGEESGRKKEAARLSHL